MKKQIFNIFQKTEKIIKDNSPKEKIKITADYREKNSLVPAELVSLGLEVEFKELKVADFIVGNVAIERKTVSDFISSMINKRLLKQLEDLQQYEKKLLLIEGIDEQEIYSDEKNMRFHQRQREFARVSPQQFVRERAQAKEIAVPQFEGIQKEPAGSFLHPNSIRGFLLAILLKYNIPILFTKNYSDTAKFIDLIARKKENEMSINAKKKARNKKEQMQFILEGFPGIGPKTAKKLLEEFKSLKEIFNSPSEKIIKLIGKKAEIFKIIDDKYL